jgi:hypothetical protein
MMETSSGCKILITIYHSAWCHVPEVLNCHQIPNISHVSWSKYLPGCVFLSVFINMELKLSYQCG